MTDRVSRAIEGTAAVGLPAGTSPHIVVRQRLVDLLDEAVQGSQLTLVCGPAGCGKTALVSMWAALRSTPGLLLWVSVDGHERGRRMFWQRVARGLDDRSAEEGVPGRSLDRRSLAATARRHARRTGPVVLVVDEGSGPPDRALHRELDGYLRHAGDALRLVLVTRVDPVLPLRQYRLAGSLAEIRVEDLSFTAGEARNLFDRTGVEVTDDQVGRLLEKTGGWPAGLVFAANYLQGRDDVEGAVDEFTGSDRAVSDFLVKEFLDAQPANVREVLLRSSVADELPVGLFEELTGAEDGQAALAFLNRANAFLSPAPGTARSYHYPPLLREFLRTRLAFEHPQLVPVLHSATARWLFREGDVHDAVRHAVAASRWDEAARYAVDGLVVGEVLNERVETLTDVLTEIPTAERSAPAAVVRAALALRRGAPGQARQVIAELRRTLASSGTISVSGPAADRDDLVLFCLELLEAGVAALDNDTDRGLETVRRAERHLHKLHPSRDDLPELRGLLATYRARLQLWSGDVHGARRSLDEVADAARAAGQTAWEVYALAQDAVLAAIVGDLDAAVAVAARADDLRREQVSPRADDQARIALARAWVMTERSLVGPAREQVARVDHSLSATDPVSRGLIAVVRSRLLHLQGYHSAARDVLAAEGRRAPESPPWVTAWMRVAGRLERGSEGMLRATGTEDEPCTLDLPGWQDAAPLEMQVTRLVLDADSALHGQDDARARASARRALADALELAAPQRLRRPFVEPPPAVRQLLRTDEDLRAAHGWLVPTEEDAGSGPDVTTSAPRQRVSPDAFIRMARIPATPADASRLGTVLIEELTAKELEVLGHLADLHTTEEIASEMFISVNTVRTHVRNVLRKLGVDRRNQAVRRAWELGLLTEPAGRRSVPRRR